MTQFTVSLVVNEEKLEWLKEHFNNLEFMGCATSEYDINFSHTEIYTNDYEANAYYYRNGRRAQYVSDCDSEVNRIIEEYLDENYGIDENSYGEDDDIEVEKTDRQKEENKLKKEFERFKNLRESYITEVEKYKKIYEDKMGIFIDSFPNFQMTYSHVEDNKYCITFWQLETQENDDSGEYYEYVRNPFFLALFLQNYMRHFSLYTPIKFKFIENADHAKQRDAGVFIIDSFYIKVITLDDIMKINIDAKMRSFSEYEPNP